MLTVAPITFAALTADPAIHLEGVTVVEGTGPTPTIATAHVVVDRPAPEPIDVLWTTSDFETSAKAFGDFGFRHEHAIIPVGALSAELTIPIPIVDDARHEPTERFRVQVLDVQNGRFRHRRANVWIADDDVRVRGHGR